jgi:hypothetical protein
VKSRISPDIEKIYEQLLWVVRRRFRIVESVSAHFGKSLVDRSLASVPAPLLPLSHEVDFRTLLDERDPLALLETLAFDIVKNEAAVVAQLRSRVSPYRDHVDEQILFGSRTAGQEAARTFLAQTRTPLGKPRLESLSVPESVHAVFELNFTGLPGDKNHFLILRPQGGSSAHFSRSAHLEAWRAGGGDARFLYEVRASWVRGILDIISPRVAFHSASSIEQGANYGLEHFYLRGIHAGP